MNPADVPTVREILADYVDVDDPYYEKLIDALNERELILRYDACKGNWIPRPRF